MNKKEEKTYYKIYNVEDQTVVIAGIEDLPYDDQLKTKLSKLVQSHYLEHYASDNDSRKVMTPKEESEEINWLEAFLKPFSLNIMEHIEPKIRTFEVIRHIDETSVSGTGLILYGAIFPDGRVAIRWTTNIPSTAFYDSMNDFMDIHINPKPAGSHTVKFHV